MEYSRGLGNTSCYLAMAKMSPGRLSLVAGERDEYFISTDSHLNGALETDDVMLHVTIVLVELFSVFMIL